MKESCHILRATNTLGQNSHRISNETVESCEDSRKVLNSLICVSIQQQELNSLAGATVIKRIILISILTHIR